MKKLNIATLLCGLILFFTACGPSDDAKAAYNRGVAKYDLKDYTGAIEDYNKAIQLNPNYAMAYQGRGTAKYMLDDKNGACTDWSKAGELGCFDAYILIKENCN